jgi:AcrR family transcriptional regulator
VPTPDRPKDGTPRKGKPPEGKRPEAAPGEGEHPEAAPVKTGRAEGAPGKGDRSEAAPGKAERPDGAPGKKNRVETAPGKGERSETAPRKGARAKAAPRDGERAEVASRKGERSDAAPRKGKRADAARNEQALLAAAAAVFVASGVDAPIREIAARAGVGMGTIYRHFPTRADLVVAVYRHQVEACAEAGPELLDRSDSPFAALRQWADLFVDFLVTKHGLANALRSDSGGFESLHAYFLDRLVPVCARLLDAAAEAGEIRSGIGAFELMRGVGNLCIGAGGDPRYDPRRMVDLLLQGLRTPPAP